MTARKPKTDAQNAADRLRRQQIKKRGEAWQDALAAGIKMLDAPHTIAKIEPPVRIIGCEGKGVFRVVFCRAGGADFEGGYRGIVTAIEAKDTAETTWHLSELDANQSDRLLATHRQNGIALVAIRMGAEARNFAWAIPWVAISAMRAAGKGSISVDDLKSGDHLAYKIPYVASGGAVVADMRPALEEEYFRLHR